MINKLPLWTENSASSLFPNYFTLPLHLYTTYMRRSDLTAEHEQINHNITNHEIFWCSILLLPCIMSCSNLYLVRYKMCPRNPSFHFLSVNGISSSFQIFQTLLFETYSIQEFSTSAYTPHFEGPPPKSSHSFFV